MTDEELTARIQSALASLHLAGLALALWKAILSGGLNIQTPTTNRGPLWTLTF